MSRRGGMTILELLVGVGIIALLLALTLPAIQRVREVAMRAESMNKLRQIGMATHHFASARAGRLPDLTSREGDPLFISLLPYMEEDNTYAAARALLRPPSDSLAVPLNSFVIKVFVSPADPTVSSLPFGAGGVASYAANAQVFSDWFARPHFLGQTLRDGASNTILFAEHYAQCQETLFTWWNADWWLSQGVTRRATFADTFQYSGQPPPRDVYPITSGNPAMSVGSVRGLTFQVRPRLDEADPRLAQTPHSGGMLVAMGDGSVRTLGRGIWEEVYWGLVTPAGSEAVSID